MNWVVGIIIGIIVGAVAAFLLSKKKVDEDGIRVEAAKKAANLRKIAEFIADKDKFTNDDIQKYLGVSNTTVGRYLQELEAAGKIKQFGDIGSGVYYTKK